MSAIRVLMLDDHPVDWEGLHAALDQANDVVVVGEARSGKSAVEAAGKLTPDIVFMDARLPGMSWLDVTKAIREASHTTEVITFGVDEPRHRSPRRPSGCMPTRNCWAPIWTRAQSNRFGRATCGRNSTGRTTGPATRCGKNKMYRA